MIELRTLAFDGGRYGMVTEYADETWYFQLCTVETGAAAVAAVAAGTAYGMRHEDRLWAVSLDLQACGPATVWLAEEGDDLPFALAREFFAAVEDEARARGLQLDAAAPCVAASAR